MSSGSDEVELAREWLAAAARADVAAALEEIYAAASQRIAERGPACWASGRCCNFTNTGHLLYVTGLEAAFTLVNLRRCRPEPLTLPQLAAARAGGGCPFQTGNLCGVHPIRPLGCRVYFCDRSATEWQQSLYEAQLTGIRHLHDRFGVPYRYAEWRSLLEALVGAADRHPDAPQQP
jgi:Fe-S-cluster containining protein